MKQLITLVNNQKLLLVLLAKMMRMKKMNRSLLLWPVSLNALRGTEQFMLLVTCMSYCIAGY